MLWPYFCPLCCNALLWQSEIASESDNACERNNQATAKFEAAASHDICNRICKHEIPIRSSACTKTVGSIENFRGSYTIVCEMLFDYCKQVIWDAVFHDGIAEYSSDWRKRKLCSGHPKITGPAPLGENLSAPLGENLSNQKSLSCNDRLLVGDVKCILDGVENELYLSTEATLAEYVEILVEDEARKVVGASKGDNMNKVI